MSVGKILALIRGTKAHAPVPVTISDGTLSFPFGHLEYYIRKQPDGMLLLDLAKKEYSEFKVYTDRNFYISLFNHVAGSRYKLFIYRNNTNPVTISFETGEEPITIEGSTEESVFVLNVEVAKVGNHVINKVVNNIYDDYVSINNTWSSQKISDKLTEEATARTNALADAKNYTDSKDSATNSRIDNEITARQNGDSNTLSAANSYTDSKDTATNQRIDIERSDRQNGDNSTLQSANNYTIYKVNNEATARINGDAQTLNDAKEYVDERVFDATKDQTLSLEGQTFTYSAATYTWNIPLGTTSTQLNALFNQLPKKSTGLGYYNVMNFVLEEGVYSFSNISIRDFEYPILFGNKTFETSSHTRIIKIQGTLNIERCVNVEIRSLKIYRGYNSSSVFFNIQNTIKIKMYGVDIDNGGYSNSISAQRSHLYLYYMTFRGTRTYLYLFYGSYAFIHSTTAPDTCTSYCINMKYSVLLGDTSVFNSTTSIINSTYSLIAN